MLMRFLEEKHLKLCLQIYKKEIEIEFAEKNLHKGEHFFIWIAIRSIHILDVFIACLIYESFTSSFILRS